MDDTLICPICGDKLKNTKNHKNLFIGKFANIIKRHCANGMNHIITLYSDTSVNKVDFLRVSLEPNYSKIIEIDFHNQKSKILLYKNGLSQTMHLQKIFEPDFPALENLRKQVNLFILLS